MTNYDLTVEELKEKKITGIKLPGSIDDFGFTVKDGNKIEVPIHGVQNGTVELELLGRADTIEFVAEEKKEEVATPNASNTTVEPKPVAATESNTESTSETHANPEPTAETAATETATPETAHAETTVESL